MVHKFYMEHLGDMTQDKDFADIHGVGSAAKTNLRFKGLIDSVDPVKATEQLLEQQQLFTT